MLFFSGCKINLGLRILRKRDDGFHDIETIFYPVAWNDVIEYQPASETSIEIFGRQLDGNPNNNTIIKAYNLLRESYELPPLEFKMLKNIPSGAGLGGGSANAATVLKQLNNDFDLNISENDLVRLAATIGSDCAFFVRNKPCVATGRGEQLKEININLKNYWLLILYPDVHIDTAWAYKTFASKNNYHESGHELSVIIHQPVSEWKALLQNDFESVVFESYPQLKILKEQLYTSNAIYASMSGSGSAVYGLFVEKPDEEAIGNELRISRLNRFSARLE